MKKKIKPLIFISHIHEETALAVALQENLSRMYLDGIDFFVSSDRRSLRGGDDWLLKIRESIEYASLVIILISHKSINRTWINFEAGASWLHKRVVPVCHSGLKPSQLPQPLQSMFSFNLHNKSDLEDLCKLVGDTASLRLPEEDWQKLSESLSHITEAMGSHTSRPYGSLPCWVFPNSEDQSTITSLSQSLVNSKKMDAFAIGLNFFWRASCIDKFQECVEKGTLKAHICMANFKSKAIIERIKEEPEHPIGVAGSDHIVRRLLRLQRKVSDVSRFEIRLFSHYPTYAILLLDDHVYMYPYGYRQLGNLSPTFFWEGSDPAARFFHEQFESLWSNSTNAEELYGNEYLSSG